MIPYKESNPHHHTFITHCILIIWAGSSHIQLNKRIQICLGYVIRIHYNEAMLLIINLNTSTFYQSKYSTQLNNTIFFSVN